MQTGAPLPECRIRNVLIMSALRHHTDVVVIIKQILFLLKVAHQRL